MKSYAIVLSLLLTTGAFAGQSGKDTVDTHVAAAKAAARQEHTSLLNLCSAPEPAPAAQQGQRAAAQPPGPPDRSKWHAEPVKVFDNLYFVGMTEYSSWAVNTSDGIIVIDAIFDYSVEDEIAKGLPKLGLDLSEENQIRHREPWSHRTLIPVKDGGKPHLAALWGGTGFNWLRNRTTYITPDRPDRFWFETYEKSASRFRQIVSKAGADIILSNHTNTDGSKKKLPALANRKAGDPHPYVISNESVQRFLTVADECAKAGLARLN